MLDHDEEDRCISLLVKAEHKELEGEDLKRKVAETMEAQPGFERIVLSYLVDLINTSWGKARGDSKKRYPEDTIKLASRLPSCKSGFPPSTTPNRPVQWIEPVVGEHLRHLSTSSPTIMSSRATEQAKKDNMYGMEEVLHDLY